MNTAEQQITCIYVSGTKFSDQIEAFLKSSKKDVLLQDISKTMPTDTQWHDMAERLNKSLKDFINQDKIDELNADTNYDEESLVKILNQNPKALHGSIVLENDRIAHITNYTQVLEFFDVDSAGLEKTLHYEKPTTESQTEDDRFIEK